MEKLVVTVAPEAVLEKYNILFVILSIALVLPFAPLLGKSEAHSIFMVFLTALGLLAMIALFYIVSRALLFRFIDVGKTPLATLTISKNGIEITRKNNTPIWLKWSDIRCLRDRQYDDTDVYWVMILKTKRPDFKTVKYPFWHMNFNRDEIMNFVYRINPYGKGINHVNDSRTQYSCP